MVRIYFCDACKFCGCYEKLLALLTEERRNKASRLLKDEDKMLSALSGAMLGKVFGNNEPLLYNEHGKPYFEHGKRFSLSHSKNLAVLAVSDFEIGVDAETPKSVNESVMCRCFTEEEINFVSGSPENFARIWTLKEAAVKLLGKGITFPLKSFSVLPFDGERTVGGTKMSFFTTIIMGVPVSVAFDPREKEFEIKEFEPEEIIG